MNWDAILGRDENLCDECWEKKYPEKKSRTSIEEDDKNRLVKSFDSLPDMVAPEIKAQYHELMIRYAN